MLVLEEQPAPKLGALSLPTAPAFRHKCPPNSCPPTTGHSLYIGFSVPGPPPRVHLAPAAGWRGWHCPQCWRLGKCRSPSCLAPLGGSTASHSAPKVGISEEDPRSLPTLPQASDPATGHILTSENGQQRETDPQAQEAKSKHLQRLVSQHGFHHPSAWLPGLHSIWCTLPSSRTYLHLALALAKVLSSELPSHMRLGAPASHTTQGQGL